MVGGQKMDKNNQITERERQILEWIRQNPMISQNDLAGLAGISRSGVAAHILNLTKKGYLRGKGYIVAPQRHVTVIGGINMDIYGIADEQLTGKTSNPGHIFHAVGGLGRNISLNLRKLGIFNYLISVYGDDVEGEQFKADASNNDMDITYSKQLINKRTSSYIYLNQPTGERFVGLDDMGINNYITPEFLQGRLDVIQNSTCVVIDSNIPESTVEWICDNFDGPIFAKAVSLVKTNRLQSSLANFHTLVINGVEAPILSGISPDTEENAIKCANQLISAGVQNVFLYVDNLGMLYQDTKQHIFYPQNYPDLENTNGDGAAATAALVYAFLNAYSFKNRAQIANTAAYITAETTQAVNEEMSQKLLEHRNKEIFS